MVKKFEHTVNSSTTENLKNDVILLLKRLRSTWSLKDIQFKIYTEGISNVLIGAWYQDVKDQILFRVYGENTELFIDRKAEIDAFQLLFEHGCGPELYATFNNGICYGFVEGKPLTLSTAREEIIYQNVAKSMAQIHKLPIKSNKPAIFEKIRIFLNNYSDDLKAEHVQRLASVGVNKAYLESEISQMEKIIATLNCPVVFSHNDTLLQNIIWNSEQKSISFIDFEYACPNYQPFDIANHFVEFPGVSPDMDYSLYPDDDFQSKWLRAYLAAYLSKKEEEIAEDDIQMWIGWVKKFSLMAHLFWTCWTVVQAHNSNIDFDFIGYGIARISEYKSRKDDFLSSPRH